MKRRLLLKALLLSSIAGNAVAQNQAAPIRISGSTTVNTNVFQTFKERISKDAGEPLEVIANGSRQGLSDLISGKNDIAMISAPLEELLPRLTELERTQFDPKNLVVSSLVETKLVFIVHESNPIKSLSIAQLSDLFTGVVTNWKEVGGPDLAVEVVSNQFSSGQRAVLEDRVTGGKKVVSTAKSVMNDPLIPGVVRQLKGGLGHTGAKNDLRGVFMLKTDRPIVQPMSLVTKGAPSGRLARVIAAAQKAAVN